MKVPRMAAAMGHIDDDLLLESTEYQIPTIQIVMLWVRNTVGFCICLALTITLYKYTIYPLFHYPSQDPWWERHIYETSDLSEIESVCGTDLLLEKMAQSEGCTANYHLELVDVNGSFDNREDWKYLLVEVCYEKETVIAPDGIDFMCFISFDGKTDDTHIVEYLTGTATTVINGYTVEYRELSKEEADAEGLQISNYWYNIPDNWPVYYGWAKFSHNGDDYYIATNSEDPNYLQNTLERLLSE